jgi:hypothetical protein
MPWWRREPLHEKLAREGGVILDRDSGEGARPPWDKAGIHGVPRPRQWDAVVSVEASDVPGDELGFVALPDGRLVVEDGAPADRVASLAAAVEQTLDPPYRAEAVRRTPAVWAIAARTIDVASLPGMPGEAVTVSVRDQEHTTLVDGERWLASLPAVEHLSAERGLVDYVVEATRLDGDLWEVRVSPL